MLPPRYSTCQNHAAPLSPNACASWLNASVMLWSVMIATPMAPTANSGSHTSPAIRIMHHPITQITPARL